MTDKTEIRTHAALGIANLVVGIVFASNGLFWAASSPTTVGNIALTGAVGRPLESTVRHHWKTTEKDS